MKEILLLFLVVAARAMPLAFIVTSLMYGTPLPFFKKRYFDWINRLFEKMGFPRIEERVVDPEAIKTFTKYSLRAYVFHLVIVTIISLAIAYDVPLPGNRNRNRNQPLRMNNLRTLIMHTVLSVIVILLPVIFLMMALYFEFPLLIGVADPEADGIDGIRANDTI